MRYYRPTPSANRKRGEGSRRRRPSSAALGRRSRSSRERSARELMDEGRARQQESAGEAVGLVLGLLVARLKAAMHNQMPGLVPEVETEATGRRLGLAADDQGSSAVDRQRIDPLSKRRRRSLPPRPRSRPRASCSRLAQCRDTNVREPRRLHLRRRACSSRECQEMIPAADRARGPAP